MKKIFLTLILSVMLVSSVHAAYVDFNGDFQNGTTIYSDWITVDHYFYGKDAYPIRTCHTETVCSSYNYHYERTCLAYSERTGRCTKRKTEKIIDDCKRYAERRICEPLGCTLCANPDGVSTNQLKLMNFEYKFRGGSWEIVPYPKDKIYTEGSEVRFRVNIPEECHPNYSIDSAVYFR